MSLCIGICLLEPGDQNGQGHTERRAIWRSINSALPRHWRVILCHQKENGTGREKRQWTAAVSRPLQWAKQLGLSWTSFRLPNGMMSLPSWLLLMRLESWAEGMKIGRMVLHRAPEWLISDDLVCWTYGLNHHSQAREESPSTISKDTCKTNVFRSLAVQVASKFHE